MESTRQNKIARLVQKDLSEIFQLETTFLFKGAMITVTKVHVTKDLSMAKAYLSIFAVGDKPGMIDEIRSHQKEIRYKLGQRISHQVRAIPELQFYLDDSLDYIENIEKLLDD